MIKFFKNENIICLTLAIFLIASIFPNVYGLNNDFQNQNILSPEVEWTRTIGGDLDDFSYSFDYTSDDGIIIIGRTESYGSGDRDIWLIKTDNNGYEQWNKTFGTPYEDIGRSVKQTSDGGYIILGDIGFNDIWLLKTDQYGNEEWNKILTDGLIWGHGHWIELTNDGGFIITGLVNIDHDSKIWLYKTDSDGNEIWNKTFSGLYEDTGYYVEQTSDNGYIICGQGGYTHPDDKSAVWLIKTDSNGEEQWNKRYSNNYFVHGYNLKQTEDDGYIIAANYESELIEPDAWLIKTDQYGNEEWNKTFGGFSLDMIRSVDITNNGYILAGWTLSYGEYNADVWIIKTDFYGNEQWNITVIGEEDEDVGWCIKNIDDNKYIISGFTERETNYRDCFLIKIFDVFENQPPNAPDILGPTNGDIGVEYPYNFMATDPDGDDVYYWILWGDGCPAVEWIGPYASGEQVILNHSFLRAGDITISAQAKDIYEAESGWGTLDINIPRTKTIHVSTIMKLFNMFPLFRLLLH